MATVVLSTAGQVIGTAIGGPIGGAIGKAVGSYVGGRIDHKLFGPGPQRVEGPRLESLDVMTAQEGVPMPALDGRAAIAGQIIWSTRLEEIATTESQGGGKGGSPQPETEVTTYSYYASFAVAVCEGPVAAWGRVWADGKLLDPSLLGEGSKTSISNLVRFYKGSETQQPDPLIVAKEGSAPAYRGIAYIVFERFPLADYGNRIPQIRVEAWGGSGEMEELIRGVDLIPGSTEWGYMPTPVRKVEKSGSGKTVGEQSENCHRYANRADLMVSLDNLNGTLPKADTVALVVAWFGDDLRAGHCRIQPRVEIGSKATEPHEWRVAGLSRTQAKVVSSTPDGKPAFGSTPADISVIEAIKMLRKHGKRVVLYPFIMMDIPGATLRDPEGNGMQGAYPWRGRIRVGKDGNVAAEVATFLGDDNDWGYRRFIRHLAGLAKEAGGVDAFLIGSEMVGMTQSTAGDGAYPFVDGLKQLAAEVRGILPDAKLSYAADWSEYHSHRPDENLFFNMDPLWSDKNIDFIGIDNYLPIADWRDGVDHLDYDAKSGRTSIYDLDYLKANIEGGEYFDWYYASDADRAAQKRSQISDHFGEDWIYRQKDLRGWWSNSHQNRMAGNFKTSLIASLGDDPAGWVDYGRLTVEPLDARAGHLTKPIKVTAGLWWSGTAVRAGLSAGQYWVRLIVGRGSSSRFWFRLSRNDGKSDLVTAWFDGTAISYQGNSLSNARMSRIDDNVFALEVLANVSADFKEFNIDVSAPAANMIIYGLEVFAYVDGEDCPDFLPPGNQSPWVPRSKPIWFTEIGCPAVDKGANQPNVFPSEISSEGAFPHFSAAIRDDFMQRQYLQASLEYWRDHGGDMVDPQNILVWAWDARPWPEFPVHESVWADGPDWSLGHWLNGRAGNAPAAEAIARRLTLYHGLDKKEFDVSAAYGQADGYAVTGAMPFRGWFQPLNAGLQVDAAEDGGKLTFRSRRAPVVAGDLTEADFCDQGEGGTYTATRSAIEDVVRDARVRFTGGDRDYEQLTARAAIETGPPEGVAEAELPLVLDAERGQAAAEAILRQAADGRESIHFSLPPSRREVQPGRLIGVSVDGAPRRSFIVQKVTRGEMLRIEAQSLAEGALLPVAGSRRPTPAPCIFGAGAVEIVFLDLPLLPGGTAPAHAGFAAAFAKPWPGGADILRSSDRETGFSQNTRIGSPARIGETLTHLPAGRIGVVSDEVLEVEIWHGNLISRPLADVLAGANALALEHSGGWEVLQFIRAELIGTRRWRLSGLMRGLRGTENLRDSGGLAPAARVVVLDGAVVPLAMRAEEVDRSFWYKFGPAGADPVDFDLRSHRFERVGLRPFAPCHLRALPQPDGGRAISWIRRTRIGGDAWPGKSADVPLDEATESYLVGIGPVNGDPVREITVSAPRFTYTGAMRETDGLRGAFHIRVAQIGETYGAGELAALKVPV